MTVGVPSVGMLTDVCRTCLGALSMTAASLSIRTLANPEGGSVSSGPLGASMTDLQLTLGEGPAVEAYGREHPVLVADLEEAGIRWPEFAPAALRAGVQAVFAFPVRGGSVPLGVLSLFRDRPGGLVGTGLSDAGLVGEALSGLVLAMQAGAASGGSGGSLDPLFDDRVVVHQATGRIAAQLNVGTSEALVRLRAYTFARDERLDRIARRVVEGALRFDGTDGPG